ncbi:protein MALE DISCOVERER 2-like isoform X1 [Apium graveolens]|uniref:protein MALE DISCOVERER 2-like isoform X1 n=1 Tax=Apium graveolens TaxID=4045 RepID=UPI003D7A81A6
MEAIIGAAAEYACLNRKLGHWFKPEEGISFNNADDSCKNLKSAIEPHIMNLVNTVRRRLAGESVNLIAARVSGPNPEETIIALPSTRSCGLFPAIPKEKKNTSLSAAESPQGPHHAVGKAKGTEKDGHSGDNGKYLIGVLVAFFVVIVATILFCVCRTRTVKNVRPWKFGLTGQLQKAFVLSPYDYSHSFSNSCILHPVKSLIFYFL